MGGLSSVAECAERRGSGDTQRTIWRLIQEGKDVLMVKTDALLAILKAQFHRMTQCLRVLESWLP